MPGAWPVLCCNCGPSGSTIYFSTLSHERHDFRNQKKRFLNIKCVFYFIFSTTSVWNISHSKKNWARYDHKCILVFVSSTRYSCLILMKLETSPESFEKSSKTKFNENPSSGSRVVPWGKRDRRTDMAKISHFSQFCERALTRVFTRILQHYTYQFFASRN
jgi:hypothetical protein